MTTMHYPENTNKPDWDAIEAARVAQRRRIQLGLTTMRDLERLYVKLMKAAGRTPMAQGDETRAVLIAAIERLESEGFKAE